jgi:hypothetical protein
MIAAISSRRVIITQPTPATGKKKEEGQNARVRVGLVLPEGCDSIFFSCYFPVVFF